MALMQYGDVVLPYSDLTDFRMEAVYEDSHTDRYLAKFNIGIETIINQDFIDLLLQGVAFQDGTAPNVVATTQLIYQRLMTPRQKLSLKFNGVEMIPERQQGVPGFVDAANGPHPLRCTIIPMDGATNTTFILLYEIEASYWINQVLTNTAIPNKNMPGNVVLYNRWEESVSIDEQQRTTKTRRGKLMIRSDNIKGWIADQVRNLMAVVSLPPGRFIRTDSTYTQDPNGLGLTYEVVDKEVFRLPPPPAYKAEAVYTEHGTKGDGKRFGEMRVRLHGANFTSQAELIKVAAALCICKLNTRGGNLLNGVADNVKALPMYNILQVGGYDNWVEYKLGVLMPAVNLRIVGFTTAVGAGNRMAVLGPRLDAAQMPDPGIRPTYFSRGSASLLLQAAAYYDPSFQNAKLGSGNETAADDNIIVSDLNQSQMNRGKIPGQAGTQPE